MVIEPRPRVPVMRYRDMRIDRWELYQRPRPVPILYGGILKKYAVFSWSLPLSCAKYRMDLWANTRHTYVMQAVDSDNWIILKRDLPQRIIQLLNALDTMVGDMSGPESQACLCQFLPACHDMPLGGRCSHCGYGQFPSRES